MRSLDFRNEVFGRLRVRNVAALDRFERARALFVAELEKLLDAAFVPAAFERRFEIDVEHSLDHLPAREPLGKRQDVAVVVAASQLGGVRLRYGTRANARDFVGGDCDAQAGSADDDASIGLPAGDGFADGVTVLRVVDRRRVVRAVVENLVTFVAQNLCDVVLIFESGVVGANRYTHGGPFARRATGTFRPEANRLPVKLAAASSALHRTIERGDLTQLEWLDLCAQELAADGVVFDVRHFPRTDGEYLAQIKKMAIDRGLTIAAVSDATFFGSPQDRMDDTLRIAVTLCAPLVAGPLAAETTCSWSDQLAALSTATSLAKTRNVTLAVRNAPGTFAATTHDCKRVAKEADSAWLRFGPEPRALDAASDPSALAANSVLLWSNVGDETERSVGDVIRGFAQFRGYLALDEPSGDASVAEMQSAMRSWRIALASIALNRT